MGRDPTEIFFALIVCEAVADGIEVIGDFHVKEEGNLIDRLALFEGAVSVEIIFMDKTETVNFHRYTGFFIDFSHHSFLCGFTELDPTAYGIEIVHSLVAYH